MSPDTDNPRQRTVAELVAAHGGDTAGTGRRARRRAAEDAADTGQAAVEASVGNFGRPLPTVNGNGGAPYANGRTPPAPTGDGYINGGGDYRNPYGGPAQPANETYGAPRGPAGGDAYRGENGNVTGPDLRPAAPTPRRSVTRSGDFGAQTPYPDSDAAFVNGGAVYADTETSIYRGDTPWTGDRSVLREPVPVDDAAPAVAESTYRSRPTEQMPRMRSDNTPMLDPGLTGPIEVQRLPQGLPQGLLQADDADGGPSTAVGLAPAGAEAWHRERAGRRGRRRADRRVDSRVDGDGGPPTAASDPFAAGGFDDDSYDGDGDLPAGLSVEPGRRRTSPVVEGSTGHAWAAVVAQWIAGAIGGAALWVGFRFLWRDLPVVALAAAALVTIGLVLVVRALMRNDDRRTTLFAVLVGLLLTVSPAILVLLGR
jgi:hypothetical protein